MEILGYEINIYVVMVIMAGIFVFAVILSMSKTIKVSKHSSKKNNKRKNKKQSIVAKETPESENEDKPSEISSLKSQAKPLSEQIQSKSLSEQPQAKLLSELPQNKQSGEQSQGKSLNEQVVSKPSNEQQQTEAQPQTQKIPSTETSSPSPEAEKSNGTMSRLWEADKVAQAKEETVEVGDTEEDEGLANLFDSDDVEESAVSELAALLSDVDLSTLNNLGTEISQVLLKQSSGSKRRHDDE